MFYFMLYCKRIFPFIPLQLYKSGSIYLHTYDYKSFKALGTETLQAASLNKGIQMNVLNMPPKTVQCCLLIIILTVMELFVGMLS